MRCKSVDEKLNLLTRVHERYRQTTDRQTDDKRTAHGVHERYRQTDDKRTAHAKANVT